MQGVRPALRTLNTLMIACNTCNEPEEALRVYETLLLPHFSPSETTFNALISVYGKLGNLNKVRLPFPILPMNFMLPSVFKAVYEVCGGPCLSR